MQCPFYREDDGCFSIVCEGFGNARYLKQRYYNKADYENQMVVFCCDHYKNCEVYRVLMEEKYDEEDKLL